MSEKSDQELLRAYVQSRDEEAFRQIVERYLGIVYAAARRQVQDAHLAEDVTQAVFIMLARKAGSLREGSVLAGWLIHAARLAAKTAMRGEIRRKRRERQAAEMTPPADMIVNNRGPLPAVDEEIDELLNRLNPADRTAVTLRYLHDRSIKEVAEIMGTSEAAANKRTLRALDKLRAMLIRRGIHLSPTIVGEVMRQQAHASALPTGMTSQAVAHGAIHGTPEAAHAAAIAHAALVAAAWKTSLAVAASLLIVATIAGVGIYAYHVTTLRSAVASARAAAPASAAAEPPVKVGVYVSVATERRDLAGRARDQFRILDELHAINANLELYPLVESDNDHDQRMANQVKFYFPDRKPIDVCHPDEIGKMDVIVAASVHYAPVDAMDSIEKAVRSGTGLVVRQCLGGDDNGYARPVVRHLRGMNNAEPDALNSAGPSEALVVGSHPLLGTLSGQLDAPVFVQTYSGYGDLLEGMTPLLKLKSIEKAVYNGDRSPVKEHPGYAIYPLVVGQLGKGRLVSASFPAERVPDELKKATKGLFMIHAVRWAAGRNLD